MLTEILCTDAPCIRIFCIVSHNCRAIKLVKRIAQSRWGQYLVVTVCRLRAMYQFPVWHSFPYWYCAVCTAWHASSVHSSAYTSRLICMHSEVRIRFNRTNMTCHNSLCKDGLNVLYATITGINTKKFVAQMQYLYSIRDCILQVSSSLFVHASQSVIKEKNVFYIQRNSLFLMKLRMNVYSYFIRNWRTPRALLINNN